MFTYKDNRTTPPKQLHCCIAEDISKADERFKTKTGLVASKLAYVSVEVKKHETPRIQN
jgi:hypothetical protein